MYIAINFYLKGLARVEKNVSSFHYVRYYVFCFLYVRYYVFSFLYVRYCVLSFLYVRYNQNVNDRSDSQVKTHTNVNGTIESLAYNL